MLTNDFSFGEDTEFQNRLMASSVKKQTKITIQ